ncbi:MAG: exonuclease domain-containing protein [Alphaproteobacteria bacterium]|nr:exonuclease domain-containing protein [Alphaproteobacteria bacterium]
MTSAPAVIVFDLEWTAWEGSRAANWSRPGEHREIVQIGAVRLDPALNEVGAIDLIVRPTLNPVLSDYFIALTGLTQARVDRSGSTFGRTLDELLDFVGAQPAVVYCNGSDNTVLAENCRINGIDIPTAMNGFRSIRPWLRDAFGVTDERIDSYKIPLLIGAIRVTTGHDALHDARCIADGMRHARHRLGIPLPHER